MANLPDYAGLVQMRRARSTGTKVGVYRAAEQGIETDPTTPWVTVCEDHSGCICHATRAQAEAWAARPEEWCPTCQGEIEDDAC